MKEKTTSAVTRAKGKTAKVPASKSANPTTAYKVLFSPKAGISKDLSRMTQAAAKEISVAAYAFSSKYLGNALVSAMKRGVKVRLILDKDNAEKAYAIDEWLIENGIDVRFIKLKSGCMHHKFLIVDRARLMTGSYNFTNDSEFRNHEAAIFINAVATTAAAVLVNAFTAEFERLWSLAAPPTISGGKG
jgi:phospholipase D